MAPELTIGTVTTPGLTGWRKELLKSQEGGIWRECPSPELKSVVKVDSGARGDLRERKLGKLTLLWLFSPNHSLTGLHTGWNQWGNQRMREPGSRFTVHLPGLRAGWGRKSGAARESWQDIEAHSHLPDCTEPRLKWTHTWQCPGPELSKQSMGRLLPTSAYGGSEQLKWSEHTTPQFKAFQHCPPHSE